jgi:uncharacterized protein
VSWGDAKACLNLGRSHDEGLGVPQDHEKANALYKKACDGGEMSGCINLGRSHGEGRGVPQDYAKANALYKKACDGGLMDSCTTSLQPS